MKYSLSIPYYQNLTELKELINSIIDCKLIDDIVITHDCSNDYSDVLKLQDSKIRVYKNINNWHILHNKRNSIYHAKNKWVICIDSDNKITDDYVRIIDEYKMDKHVIYAPEFAKPQFDYRAFSGQMLHKETIKEFAKVSISQTFLNTFNYCVNRNEYLKVYRYTTECKSSDSIYFNYLWLAARNSIFIVPELQYEHKVHPNSTFLKEYAPSLKMANEYLYKIIKL